MSLRTLVHVPHPRRALVVMLALAACTDSQVLTAPGPTAPARLLTLARPPIAANQPAPSPALVVTPATVAITQGGGIQLGAVNVDPFDVAQSTAPVTWTSSNPSVATVSSTGLVRAIAHGTVAISAITTNPHFFAKSIVSVAPRPTCWHPTPLPTDLTGEIKPITPGYEDAPMVFRMDVGDPDPCHKYTFRMLEGPVSGALYQVADDGTVRLDARIGDDMTVSNGEGWVAYYPNANYNGVDSFRYNVTDEAGRLYRFFVPVPLSVQPVNDPPFIFPSPPHIGANDVSVTNVLLQYRDVDDLNTIACIAELPRDGDLYWGFVSPANRVVKGECRKSSSLRYVSVIDGVGGCRDLPAKSSYPHMDSFRWYASDGRTASDTATDSIRIDYENQPPVYRGPTRVSTTEDTPVAFSPSGSDPDGDAMAFQINSLPRHGTLWRFVPGEEPTQIFNLPALMLANGDGITTLRYVPDADFNTLTQTDDIQITVTDGNLLESCGQTVTFDVASANDAPTIAGPEQLTAFVAPGGIGQPTGVCCYIVSDDARPSDVLSLTVRAQGPAAGRIDFIDPTGFAATRVSAMEVRFEGTIAAINALLGRGVQWTPNGSGATYGELAIVVDDRGNTGSGGALVGTKIVPVEVAGESDGLERIPVAAPVSVRTVRRLTPE